jgi:hypothetical protein
MYIQSSSDGHSLIFPTKELNEEYNRKILAVKLEMYDKVRRQYGVWASNQDKFVDSATDFNSFDSKTMEHLWKVSKYNKS